MLDGIDPRTYSCGVLLNDLRSQQRCCLLRWGSAMPRVAVFGSVTMEFTFRVEEWPVEGGKALSGAVSGWLGGKGLFQAMASHRMDMPTTLISSVANDVFGSK